MNINEDNELNNYQIMYVTPVEAYTLMESSMAVSYTHLSR